MSDNDASAAPATVTHNGKVIDAATGEIMADPTAPLTTVDDARDGLTALDALMTQLFHVREQFVSVIAGLPAETRTQLTMLAAQYQQAQAQFEAQKERLKAAGGTLGLAEPLRYTDGPGWILSTRAGRRSVTVGEVEALARGLKEAGRTQEAAMVAGLVKKGSPYGAVAWSSGPKNKRADADAGLLPDSPDGLVAGLLADNTDPRLAAPEDDEAEPQW